MDKKTRDAIKALVDYLKVDEAKHWNEMNRPKNHIYNQIRIVDKWLDQTFIEFNIKP